MPLRDHFRPPLSKLSSFGELHGQWPAVMVQHLGKVLPRQYVAGPHVHLGTQIEVDVATFDQNTSAEFSPVEAGGTVATVAWAPSEPTLKVETELADFDAYEVRVYDVERDRRLVAAIELISPANKDRPEARQQFVAKCAALLREQVCVVLVDLASIRDFNLYAELLGLIGAQDASLGDHPPASYAVACRWRRV